MIEYHYLEWTATVTDDGAKRTSLSPIDEPKVVFCDKENAEIYMYCNLYRL
jgi:superoxide reductase